MDDAEPTGVSPLLASRLFQLRLTPAEPALKHFEIRTYWRLGSIDDDVLELLVFQLCASIGFAVRLRRLRDEARNADVYGISSSLIGLSDAEPQIISNKLRFYAKEFLIGFLATVDVLSFEGLGNLTKVDIDHVCNFGIAQGYDPETTACLYLLHAEATHEVARRGVQQAPAVPRNAAFTAPPPGLEIQREQLTLEITTGSLATTMVSYPHGRFVVVVKKVSVQ